MAYSSLPKFPYAMLNGIEMTQRWMALEEEKLSRVSDDIRQARRKFGKSKLPSDMLAMRSEPMRFTPRGYDCEMMGVVMHDVIDRAYFRDTYGMIDISDLMENRATGRVSDNLVKTLLQGGSWNEALEGHRKLAITRLKKLTEGRPMLVMVPDADTARYMGICVLSVLCLRQEAFDWYAKRMDPCEKRLAAISRSLAVREEDNIEALGMPDVESLLSQVCQVNDVPMAAPWVQVKLENPTGYQTKDVAVLQGVERDLVKLVELFDTGMVPRECVDHAVNKQGLDSYMGFGDTKAKQSKALVAVEHDEEVERLGKQLESKYRQRQDVRRNVVNKMRNGCRVQAVVTNVALSALMQDVSELEIEYVTSYGGEKRLVSITACGDQTGIKDGFGIKKRGFDASMITVKVNGESVKFAGNRCQLETKDLSSTMAPANIGPNEVMRVKTNKGTWTRYELNRINMEAGHAKGLMITMECPKYVVAPEVETAVPGVEGFEGIRYNQEKFRRCKEGLDRKSVV